MASCSLPALETAAEWTRPCRQPPQSSKGHEGSPSVTPKCATPPPGQGPWGVASPTQVLPSSPSTCGSVHSQRKLPLVFRHRAGVVQGGSVPALHSSTSAQTAQRPGRLRDRPWPTLHCSRGDPPPRNPSPTEPRCPAVPTQEEEDCPLPVQNLSVSEAPPADSDPPRSTDLQPRGSAAAMPQFRPPWPGPSSGRSSGRGAPQPDSSQPHSVSPWAVGALRTQGAVRMPRQAGSRVQGLSGCSYRW